MKHITTLIASIAWITSVSLIQGQIVGDYNFEGGSFANTQGSGGTLNVQGNAATTASPFTNDTSFSGSGALSGGSNGLLHTANTGSAFTSNTFTIEALFTYQDANDVLASVFNSGSNSISWLFGTRGSASTEGVGLWFAYSTDGTSGGRTDLYATSGAFGSMVNGNEYYVALSVDMADTSSSGINFFVQDVTTSGNSLNSLGVAHTDTSLLTSNAGTNFVIGDIDNAVGSAATGVNYGGTIDAIRYTGSQLDSSQLLIAVPEPSTYALLILGFGALVLLRKQSVKNG
ncbi:MAG: PEP-CTERM sorting domain-containing protein [Verrucomicrobiota bacterium]